MSEPVATTPLKAIFTFPFQGPDWRSRFFVGSMLLFAGFSIPIVPGIFVCGYVLQIMRQAIEGEDLILPVWKDWSKLAMDGLRGTVISLVYFLPGMIAFFGGMALYFATAFVFPLLMSAAEEGGEIGLGLLLLPLATMAITFLSMFVGSVLFLLGAIPLPVATAHFVAQDKVSAAFRVREWWALLRINKLGYFISWVMVIGLAGILYFAFMIVYYTVVLCCLIPFVGAPIGFYVSLVSAALFGQTYRESTAILSASRQATSE